MTPTRVLKSNENAYGKSTKHQSKSVSNVACVELCAARCDISNHSTFLIAVDRGFKPVFH